MRIVGVVVVFAVLASGWAVYRINQPYAGFREPVMLDIPKGTGSGRMADMLARAGVVRSRWEFLAARLFHRGRTLKAGEYRFEKPASAVEVYGRIARGDIFYYELTVPEGWSMFDIGQAVEHLGLFPSARFVEAARDPSAIRDLDSAAPSLEGYLFPSTYRLSTHTTPQSLVRIMTGKFREVWRGLKTGTDVHRMVILASLVEKEGKLPGERPMIAAVFQRRLEIGMKLDCDPTTIYAAQLDGRWDGVIHRSDLDSESPYNTYRHAGLPPGAIANPGRASLEAVLAPADTDALYFVVRPGGSGAHTFSRDLSAQQAAVVKYRRGRRNGK